MAAGLPTKLLLVLVLVFSFPAQVTELPLNNINATKENCTAESEFWDEEDQLCRLCSTCGPGYGPSGVCGHGTGQRDSCEICASGTFSNHSSTKQCRRCQHCENREVLQPCTTKQDTVCGKCLYRFVMLEGTSVCVACSTLQGHDHPGCPDDVTTPGPDEPTTITTTTPQTPSAPQSESPDLSVVPSSEPSNDPKEVPVHTWEMFKRRSESWKNLALAMLAVIVVIVVSVLVKAVLYARGRIRKRVSRNRRNSNGTSDQRMEEIELPTVRVLPGRQTKQSVHFSPDVRTRSADSDNDQLYDSPSEIEPLLPSHSRNPRPAFHRSFSAPAGDNDLQHMKAEIERHSTLHRDSKNKELERLCRKACLAGTDKKIQDFSYVMKEKIAEELDPKPDDLTHKYWFHFGLLWGISEQKLKNFDKKTMAVFDYIGPRGHSVDELVRKLEEMDHQILLKEVCEHVIQLSKKPPS